MMSRRGRRRHQQAEDDAECHSHCEYLQEQAGLKTRLYESSA